jgi:HSP20 family protein
MREEQSHAISVLRDDLRRALGTFYERIGRYHHGVSGHIARDLEPPADVTGMDGGLRISIELPGIDPDDVTVELRHGRLIVKGSKADDSIEEKADYVLRERYYGHFERSFALPLDLNTDKVSAEFKNGVLQISAPMRRTATGKGKKIKFASR